MPDATPQLSFGAISVADLLAAARSTADPTPLVDWEQLSESPTTLANGDDACRFQFSKRAIS
jgi:hypothetical protein